MAKSKKMFILERIEKRHAKVTDGLTKLRDILEKREANQAQTEAACEEEQALVDAIEQEIADANAELGDLWVLYDIAVDDLHNCLNG